MKRRLALAALLIAASPAAAQDARAVLSNTEGTTVGTVALTQLENGVLVELGITEMPAGVYGFHLHETGACAPDFEAAGGHFAPRGNAHGFDNPDGPHAGDFPNVEVIADLGASAEFVNDRISLSQGNEAMILDDDGAAFILHEDLDSYEQEASAGGRLACGVVEAL